MSRRVTTPLTIPNQLNGNEMQTSRNAHSQSLRTRAGQARKLNAGKRSDPKRSAEARQKTQAYAQARFLKAQGA